MSAGFLPSWPPSLNSLALFGLILLIGLVGGRLAAMTRVLPSITGFIAVGFLLGPGGLNWLTQDTLRDTRIFVDIALGLVLFALGRRLDFQWLKHDRWLLPTALLESAFGYAAMYALLLYFRVDTLQAAVIATIGIATSPAVVLVVAHELRAEGPVTRRALALVAINNIVAMLGLTVLLPLIRSQHSTELVLAVSQSAYVVAGSFLLGYVMFRIAATIARWIGKAESHQLILTVGMILVAVGAAEALRLSVLLSLLTFGIFARNIDHEHRLIDVEFGVAGELFFIVLFVVSGATLRLDHFGPLAWLGCAVVAVRFLGKALGVLLPAWPGRVSLKQAAMLSFALTPMSGIAIGMAQEIYDIYPEFGAQITAILVSGIAIVQIVGPIATRFAFRYAGESEATTKGS